MKVINNLLQLVILIVTVLVHSFTASSSNDLDSYELKTLITASRHGDRAPVFYYPTDSYKPEKIWPEGAGHLTNSGRQRMYRLGQFFRRYYGDFLVNHRKMYARSSDTDRCIESAQMIAAGLYPPKSSFVWNRELLWIPMPIHTVPKPLDNMLAVAWDCPSKKDHLMKNFEMPSEYQPQIDKLRDFCQKKTGMTLETEHMLSAVYDNFLVKKQNGLDLPSWIQEGDENYELLKKIHTMSFDYSERHRVESGLFYRTLREIIEEIKKDSNEYNYYLFSTHDFKLSAYFSSLGISIDVPTYGATMIFEIYRHRREPKHIIRVRYINDTESEIIHTLIPPRCGNREFCTEKEFFSVIEPVIIEDFSQFCQLQPMLLPFTWSSLPGCLLAAFFAFILSSFISRRLG